MKQRTEPYIMWAIGLIALYCFGTLSTKLSLFGAISSHGMAEWIVTALYLVLIAVIWLQTPRMHVPGRLHFRGTILGYAFAGALIFLLAQYGVALFLKGITATGYDISPGGIAANLLRVLPAMVLRELVRAYALGTAAQRAKRPQLWWVLLTLLLAALELNVSKLQVLQGMENWVVYLAQEVLPALAEQCLLTVLVLYGGAVAGVLYSGGVYVFLHVFPYLPTLPWVADGALGIAFPVIMAIFIHHSYLQLGRGRRRGPRQEPHLVRFTIALVLAVTFLWFVVGVFPIYPSVVLTGSMEPGIMPGDIVLIRKIKEENDLYLLREGDILNFNRGEITITHRIIRIEKDEHGNLSFVTKGDNNKSEDQDSVLPNEVNGTIVNVIPKAGLPVLLMHRLEPVPEGVTEEHDVEE